MKERETTLITIRHGSRPESECGRLYGRTMRICLRWIGFEGQEVEEERRPNVSCHSGDQFVVFALVFIVVVLLLLLVGCEAKEEEKRRRRGRGRRG